GKIFPVRTALAFEKSSPLGLPSKAFQGDSYYVGENLGPVALITYYLKEGVKTKKQERQASEAEAAKAGKGNSYPTYEDLKAERDEIKAEVLFTIKDNDGKVVRKLTRPVSAGVQRLEWDLRYASKEAIDLNKSGFYNPFAGKSEGTLVDAGIYSVSMALYQEGKMQPIGEVVRFEVQSLEERAIPVAGRAEKVAFQREVAELSRSMEGAQRLIGELNNKLQYIQAAIKLAEIPSEELLADANTIATKLTDLRRQLFGDELKRQLDIDQIPSPMTRIGWIDYEQKYSMAAPTKTHRMSFDIAKKEFQPILNALQTLATQDMPVLEQKLEEADAPYTPGRAIKMMQGN
ncbi:MAG: hypothetical protein AAF738_11960, partial [Bacteroidota bacterium]